MGLKHVSAYLYGFGFGIATCLTTIGSYPLRIWLLVWLLFTIAYLLDRRGDT